MGVVTMAPPVRSIFLPARIVDELRAIIEAGHVNTIKIGFVRGAPAWFYVGGDRDNTVRLPLWTERRGGATMPAMADTSDQLRAEQEDLQRLVHLVGYQAALMDYAAQIDLTAIAIGELSSEGDDLMSVAQILKDAAAATRTGNEQVQAAVARVKARISDNEEITAEDKAAILTDLTAADTASAATLAEADTIDADVPGGVIEDPANPGDVIEAPPA